jgi:hypothetical protein
MIRFCQFWTKQLPAWLVQRWREAPIIDALHLPHANPFIPSNLSLKWTPTDRAEAPTPAKVHDSDGLHIWHAIVRAHRALLFFLLRSVQSLSTHPCVFFFFHV